MKFLISGLRTLIVASAALVLLTFIVLSFGWHTPLVNHFSAPYKISVNHTELNWFPLSLEVEGLHVGEGRSALKLERIHVRSGLGFLTGNPVELYVQLENGHVAYQQLTNADDAGVDWQFAGLSLTQWQQLFASEVAGSERRSADPESPTEPDSKAPLAIHLQSLQISNFTADSLQKGLPDLQLKRLLFGPFYTDQPEKRSSLQVELATAGGTVDLKGALSPLSAAQQINFDLTVNDFAAHNDWLAQIPAELSATLNTRLALDIALSASDDESAVRSLTAGVTGDLQLEQVAWQPSGADASPDREVNKPVEGLQTSPSESPAKVVAAEEKTAENAVPVEVYGFESLAINKLNFQVKVADLAQVEPQMQFAFDQLQLNALNVRQADLSYQLQSLLLKQLNISADQQAARIESGAIEIAQGEVDYRLPKNEPAKGESVAEDETVAAVDATVDKSADGNNAGSDKPVTDAQANSAKAVSDSFDDVPAPYQIRFAGESVRLQKHHITYQDLNLDDAPLTQIELADIQLNQPRYPAVEPFSWLADIWLNGQSHWVVSGDLQTAPLKVNVSIDQSGLSLPDISPYSEHYAEVVFAEGMMDNKIQFEITSNSLKGSLGFDFTHLDMTLKGSQKSLNLPLQTAFSLLRDSDSRIELSIDLDKKGEDLKVGTSAIVKELLLAASQKGAVAYLKYALQPYGALLTLKEVGSSLLRSGSLPLEPVVLNPLQDTFTTDQVGYARKVSGILKEKTEFKLNYCYLPSDAERNLLLKQLGDAAKADAAVKELNQNRLTQLRKLFAAEGLASRMKQCTQDELNKQRKKLSAAEAEKSRFTLLLKP